jgi:nitroreductase
MMDLQSVDDVLTTTRAVRRKLDLNRPVEREVIEECLEIAVQAPSGSDGQGWHFLVITDPQVRLGLADLYRRSFDQYIGRGPATSPNAIRTSAIYLAEHMHEVPVLLVACYEGRVEQGPQMAQAGLYGSILPAVWSFMLAARARGLGTAWTTLHLRYEQEAAALLGLPPTITQAALIPVAYVLGDPFKPGARRSASEVTHWDRWE